MGVIKDKIQYAINKLSSYYSITRYSGGDTIDNNGTPATNSNYGLPTTKISTTLNVLLNIQFPSANDLKDKNFIDYQNRGYTLKGIIKIKAITENILNEGDLITYNDGKIFEVVEWTNRYVPLMDGTYTSEYCYSEGLALLKEIQ